MGFGVDRVPTNYKVLGLHQLTYTQTTAATHTTFQDEGLSKSVDYGPSRILRVSIQVHAQANGGANSLYFKIMRGSTDLIRLLIPDPPTTLEYSTYWSYVFNGPVAAGTEIFKVQFAAVSANTQVATIASAVLPRVLLIEDLGPQ